MINNLLLVFTSPTCSYCPGAHETVKELSAKYPDHFLPVIIPASVHYNSNNDILMDGQRYYNKFNLTFLPSAILNLKEPAIMLPDWENAIKENINNISQHHLDITVEYIYNAIYISLNSPDDNYNGKLLIWQLKDNEKIIQKNIKNKWEETYYNNYFQKSITPIDGDDINLIKNIPYNISYSNIDNLSNDTFLLIIIYNNDGNIDMIKKIGKQ